LRNRLSKLYVRVLPTSNLHSGKKPVNRSPLHLLAIAFLALATLAQAAGKFTADEYKRALWMATRFYGGQRSGEGPNWLLIGQPDSLQKSFLLDSYGGQDVSGGWFDCGDHVMFGQTQYWAAYSLAKAYETFPTGYDDLYDGSTYADYKQSGKWNDVDGGTPNGIPDLVDELVYQADYIAKAVISKDVFITLKADPDADHKRWVTAPMMSKMSKTLGGECASGGEEKYEAPDWTFKGNLTPCTGYSTRSIKADKDKAMASNAAATLAVMARILDRLGVYPERVKLYTDKAKVAYEHASAISGTIAYGMFYSANPNQWDDFVSASAEMYLLTKEQKYLDAAKSNEGQVNKNHNWAFSYNNADDGLLQSPSHRGQHRGPGPAEEVRRVLQGEDQLRRACRGGRSGLGNPAVSSGSRLQHGAGQRRHSKRDVPAADPAAGGFHHGCEQRQDRLPRGPENVVVHVHTPLSPPP